MADFLCALVCRWATLDETSIRHNCSLSFFATDVQLEHSKRNSVARLFIWLWFNFNLFFLQSLHTERFVLMDLKSGSNGKRTCVGGVIFWSVMSKVV